MINRICPKLFKATNVEISEIVETAPAKLDSWARLFFENYSVDYDVGLDRSCESKRKSCRGSRGQPTDIYESGYTCRIELGIERR